MTFDSKETGWQARSALVCDAMLFTLLVLLLAKLVQFILGGSLNTNLLYWGVALLAPSTAVFATWGLYRRKISRRLFPALAASSLAGWLISAGALSLFFLINTPVAAVWWLAFAFLAALALGMTAAAAVDLLKGRVHVGLDAARIAGLAAVGLFLAQTPRYDSGAADAGLELLLVGALVLTSGVVMVICDKVAAPAP
jgi:hypothetical protein